MLNLYRQVRKSFYFLCSQNEAKDLHFVLLFLSHSCKTDRRNLLVFWPKKFSIGWLGESEFYSESGLKTRQKIYTLLLLPRP